MNRSRPSSSLVVIALSGALVAGCAQEPAEEKRPSEDSAASGASLPASTPAPPLDADDPYTDLQAPDGSRGRWMMTRTERADRLLTPAQKAEIERLGSLGYLSGSAPARESIGVTFHDPKRTNTGWNLYSSGHGPEATLMDMEGTELHRWRMPFAEAWPNDPAIDSNESTEYFRRCYLYENGDLLAVFEGLGIIKIDKDSRLLWAQRNNAHHDVTVLKDGSVLVLTRIPHIVDRLDPQKPILEDYLSYLDPQDGRERRRVSVLECLENSDHRQILETRRLRTGDILHTNAVFVLTGERPVPTPWYKNGHVLVSMSRINTVCVIDPDQVTAVAAWKGVWAGQHDPRILENGNMMLFDNNGTPGKSRIFEMDSVTGDLAWHYEGSLDHPFFTPTCGTASRLANGNTLITESDNGRAFEVTPDGEIVWEFHNPARAGENDEYVATLFDVVRFDPGQLPFLR